MSNRFRVELPEDDPEPEVKTEVKEKAEIPRNFVTNLFTDGVISKQAATEMLPFVFYLAFLCLLYISNRHLTEKSIRKIDKLNKEVKELSWDFKSVKADLMLKSTQTEVAKKVDTLGLKEPVEPPQKIIVSADEYQD
ncbi:MAG TPA: FtsL-like putative cell division protein [Sphingobacteriaceae bacterium]